MRPVVLILAPFFLLTFQSCSVKGEGVFGESWLNIKYVECLKNNLPCECQKSVETYYSLVLDVNPESRNFGIALSKFEQMEPYLYPIRKNGENEFIVIDVDKVSSSMKVYVKEDGLELVGEFGLSKFVKSNSSEGYDLDHYLLDNVAILNEAFIYRGYSTMEKIVGNDSLRCDCNEWMGNLNVLYVTGAPKSWILTIKNDSLSFDKIINTDRDPDDPLETERVSIFKWDQ